MIIHDHPWYSIHVNVANHIPHTYIYIYIYTYIIHGASGCFSPRPLRPTQPPGPQAARPHLGAAQLRGEVDQGGGEELQEAPSEGGVGGQLLPFGKNDGIWWDLMVI